MNLSYYSNQNAAIEILNTAVTGCESEKMR